MPVAILLLAFALPASAAGAAPVTEQPFSIAVKGGKINGTLMLPAVALPADVAVIVGGSGPMDRDGNGPRQRTETYKKLAAELAARGIATLRYDKRDSGTSVVQSEETLRFGDLVDDALAITTALEHDARFRSVSLVGHSEGALVGILVAERDPHLKHLVLLESPGRNLAAITDEQVSSNPAVPPAVAAQVRAIDASLRSGKSVGTVDPSLDVLFRPSVQPYLISEDTLDPGKELAGVHMPVLIVQGTTDLQISLRDERVLAAADPSARSVVIDGMNHLLVDVSSDRAKNFATYADTTLPLDVKMLASVSSFLGGGSAPAASVAAATPAATSEPAAPTPSAKSADPIADRAKEWLQRLQTGKIDRTQLTPKANDALTDDLISRVSSQIGPLGTPKSFVFDKKETTGSDTSYVYRVTFPSAGIYFIFALDEAGKISGMLLQPGTL